MSDMAAGSQSVRVRVEFGPYLIGRDVGRRIREEYFSGEPSTWPHAMDLSGVEQITESCADELFGALARRTDVATIRAIKLKGRTATVREAIDYVLSLVEQPPPSPTREGIERLLHRRKSDRVRA